MWKHMMLRLGRSEDKRCWAAQKGIPSILLEYGCQGMWSKKEVDSCKKGVYNLMKYLGIVSGEAKLDVPEYRWKYAGYHLRGI